MKPLSCPKNFRTASAMEKSLLKTKSPVDTLLPYLVIYVTCLSHIDFGWFDVIHVFSTSTYCPLPWNLWSFEHPTISISGSLEGNSWCFPLVFPLGVSPLICRYAGFENAFAACPKSCSRTLVRAFQTQSIIPQWTLLLETWNILKPRSSSPGFNPHMLAVAINGSRPYIKLWKVLKAMLVSLACKVLSGACQPLLMCEMRAAGLGDSHCQLYMAAKLQFKAWELPKVGGGSWTNRFIHIIHIHS